VKRNEDGEGASPPVINGVLAMSGGMADGDGSRLDLPTIRSALWHIKGKETNPM
jgi:hypothetical protein